MNTYTIYLEAIPIANICGTEYAYEVWFKTKELADLVGKDACMVWDKTGEEVTSFTCEWEEV